MSGASEIKDGASFDTTNNTETVIAGVDPATGLAHKIKVASDGTVATSASVSTTGLATDTGQTTTNTSIGATNETAPASDTATSGLNGRLQRIAQRLTSLIALLPAALTGSGNLKAALVESTASVTVAQSTASNLKVDLSGTAANSTAIKVDGSAVNQPSLLVSRVGVNCVSGSTAASGDTPLVAAGGSGKFIKVKAIYLDTQVTTGNTVKLRSNTTEIWRGTLQASANCPVDRIEISHPQLITIAGDNQALNLNLSAATNVNFSISYEVDTSIL